MQFITCCKDFHSQNNTNHFSQHTSKIKNDWYLSKFIKTTPADCPAHTAPHTPPDYSDTRQTQAAAAPRAADTPSPSPRTLLSSNN